ncbi:MAG: beta-N-acetylhexosaminidase [Desulfobacteraceae bacterium]|nr:MAG: beta-N-acetylhexosaminidase [Desulfobacteraceae bacterium]
MTNLELSESQQAGQRLMIGFNGTDLNDALRYAIDTLKVGGLILFSRNIVSPDQIRELCGSAQAYAAHCGQPPLFIAIDQEGGSVARLKPPFTQFAGNPAMRSMQDAAAFARTTAGELAGIGVNMNMAPVLDVAPPQSGSIMQKRVFGSDPQWVAQMGATVITHLQANGIMAVGKHFPGIGRTVLDSHIELPDLDSDAQTLAGSDLLPFQAAVRAGVCGIMLSHIRYTAIDPQRPASLSEIIADDWLRRQLGFNGLVLTDDLDMGAIAKYHGMDDIVPHCLQAGVDILLICHAGPAIEVAFKAMLSCGRSSEKQMQKSAQSVRRILEMKARWVR